VPKKGERVKPQAAAKSPERLPFDATTRYSEDFIARQREPEPVASMPNPAPRLPFEGNSTYQAEFQPKKGVAAEPAPAMASPAARLPFEGDTEYSRSFSPKRPAPIVRYPVLEQPSPSAPPAGASNAVTVSLDRLRAPFESTTVYRSDFVPRSTPAVDSAVYAAPHPGRPHIPFEGDTTYHQDFQARAAAQTAAEAPTPAPARRSLPFEGVSAYQAEFGPKEAAPVAPPQERVIPPPQVPFVGTTSYHQDFGPKRVSTASPPPPAGPAPARSPVPFEGATTYSLDYKAKKGLASPAAAPHPLRGRHQLQYRLRKEGCPGGGSPCAGRIPAQPASDAI